MAKKKLTRESFEEDLDIYAAALARNILANLDGYEKCSKSQLVYKIRMIESMLVTLTQHASIHMNKHATEEP